MTTSKIKNKDTALIIVDMQNDFSDNGILAVKGMKALVPYINNLIDTFSFNNQVIIATKDNHPKDHSSFKSQSEKGLWPDHCVQNTHGNELLSTLNTNEIKYIVNKGENKLYESYSAFEDESGNKTPLLDILRDNKIRNLYMVGIALDFCLKQTLIDALKYNYNVMLDLKGCSGLDKDKCITFVNDIKDKVTLIV